MKTRYEISLTIRVILLLASITAAAFCIVSNRYTLLIFVGLMIVFRYLTSFSLSIKLIPNYPNLSKQFSIETFLYNLPKKMPPFPSDNFAGLLTKLIQPSNSFLPNGKSNISTSKKSWNWLIRVFFPTTKKAMLAG